MPYLSIIIPAYNEERRIAETLDKMHHFLKIKDYAYEVIVVDDGSADRTVDIAETSLLANEHKLKIIKNKINRGKGFSVKNGINSSSGEHVLFSDADLSTPIEESDKLFEEIKRGYDIVIGSRAMKDSDVRIHQPWYREAMGKMFNFFIKLFLMKGFNDTQCGFKLFKASIAKNIASKMTIDGFCFDVEMLYIARVNNYKIKEVGIVWDNSAASKVDIFNSSIRMFCDIFRIRRPVNLYKYRVG